MKSIHFIFLIVFHSLLSACGGDKNPTGTEAKPDQPAATSLHLSPEQIQTAGIVTDTVQHRVMTRQIEASGMLDVPPQKSVSISVALGGYLKKIEMLEGMHVHQGDLLAVLENPDYIQMQQDYLELTSQKEFSQADFERQTDLAKDQVNSQKALQQAKSTNRSLQARITGLKEKLTMLGISLKAVEEGRFQNSVSIRAPIDGYVSKVNFTTGQFANPSDVILLLVDTRHIHAEITVFEKDISRIQKGQKVRVFLPNEPGPRLASVFLIGKSIGPNRDIRVHCHLDREDETLLPGMFVKAEIETEGIRQLAVPEESVVDYDDKSFIFTEVGKEGSDTRFALIQVKRGVSSQGFVAIQPDKPLAPNQAVVVKNARSLLAALYNTGEDE